jgi:hypothetical protein
MDNVYVAVAAGLGAIVAGLLGWSESKEPFSATKYLPTILRAGLAAFLGALVTPVVAPVGWVILTGAFVAGMGIDAGLKRAMASLPSIGATNPPK